MTVADPSRPLPLPLLQRVEEAVRLRDMRSMLVRAPHVRLAQLGNLDAHIAAHLEGIGAAGEHENVLWQRALDHPGNGTVFTATTSALVDRDAERLDVLLAMTEALPAGRAGLLSAFGWVSASDLHSVAPKLVAAPQAWRREVGLATYAMHGVDPRSALDAALRDGDQGLRVRALRVAAICGRRDLAPACVAALEDGDARWAVDAAWAALMLGATPHAVRALEAHACDTGLAPALRLTAMHTVLKVVSTPRAHALLAALAKDPSQVRMVVRGIALAGDPHHVPWLIAQMDEPQWARLAGEAFSCITGLDLADAGLQREPPFEKPRLHGDDRIGTEGSGLTTDPDDHLPWPDPAGISRWWGANRQRFAPGTRYFMGAPPSSSQCLGVLKTGCQRQRIAAAEYLTLLQPGTPLFNVAAPAWRQQRLLQMMGG